MKNSRNPYLIGFCRFKPEYGFIRISHFLDDTFKREYVKLCVPVEANPAVYLKDSSAGGYV